ncbi:hypothetical protein MPTK2_3g10825 [Marchantia polymorpha subsp. ruderalis]
MHLHESAVGVAWNAADEAKVPGSDQETSSSWSQGHRAKMFQSGSKHVGKVIMLHDPRDIEEDDTLPAGEVFISSKKGNVVFIAPYSMARMTSIWGPDAAQFNPDRWLQSGKLEPASDSKLVTFQAGLILALFWFGFSNLSARVPSIVLPNIV